MKLITLHETYIGTPFPCALEYGDNSGLIDNEERELDNWVLDLINIAEDRYNIHDPVVYFDYGEQSEFETCDITGLKGNCVAVTAFILV